MVKKNKKILITGAKGILGSALCLILNDFYDVIAMDKKECDVSDKKQVEKAINNLPIDAVVHCAGYTNVDEAENNAQTAFLVNTQGPQNVLGSLKSKECLFIYISTDYVFDGQKKEAYTEDDKANPLNVYGKSKLKGESLVKEFKRHLILRTSWLFGGGGINFVNTILNLAKEKKTINVVNDQVGSPTYTLDLSKAIKTLLDIYFKKGIAYGIYNVTNSGKCTWYEFAQYIAKTAGLKIELKPVSSIDLGRKAKRPGNSLLSNKKFYSLTGFYLPSWQEAVGHYLKVKFHE
jgi:dTDP-4-dehydrorhamnose reductase